MGGAWFRGGSAVVPVCFRGGSWVFPGRISALIESLDLSLAGIHVNEFEDDIVVYPVLHRRHADLAQPLQQVLSEMKAQGLFEQYMEETRKVFLLSHDQ